MSKDSKKIYIYDVDLQLIEIDQASKTLDIMKKFKL